ncbi:MAG: hypothetical protein JXK04_00770 [Campylobacterales bacterium]|nr:hypothetical protein [Campylobacterales bacterium]
MNRIADCPVSNPIELLYAKTMLKNCLKSYPSADPAFLEFALMELGNNLLKHAGKGRLWLILSGQSLGIASIDDGPGIIDIPKAMSQGHTTLEHSLGIGLYSLSAHAGYRMGILSFSPRQGTRFTGTILTLVESSSIDPELTALSLPLYNAPFNGDFIVRRGKHLFIADVSGHGKKAFESAQEAISFFMDAHLSCPDALPFFKELHDHIQRLGSRSLVGCIIELAQNRWYACGVGNVLAVMFAEGRTHSRTFAPGIVGEAIEELSNFSFERTGTNRLAVFTDGIDPRSATEVLANSTGIPAETIVVALTHFAGTSDDQTALILS